MKTTLAATAALLATTSMVAAGGIDRGSTNYGALFEEGDYLELGFTSLNPSVSGDYPTGLGGGSTGGMANSEFLPSLAYKQQLTDQFAIGFFVNRPFGADAEYTQGAYAGLDASWSSTGTTVLGKYDINDNFSVYGGLRYVVSSAEIEIPALVATGGATANPAFDFTASGDRDGRASFVGGVAYERPEIALRVALTYEQGYTHKLDTTENSAGFGLTDFASVTEIEMPQAVVLDFRTGVAQDTLVFGSIRYATWSDWEVRTEGFDANTGERITGFDNDTTTFNLGVGRRINDQISVFARVGYEDPNKDVASRLSPTDGSRSIGVGTTYTMGNMKVTGVVQYAELGDATDASGVEFSGNSAIGLALNFGYTF